VFQKQSILAAQLSSSSTPHHKPTPTNPIMLAFQNKTFKKQQSLTPTAGITLKATRGFFLQIGNS
jgi:hypothetical protein